MTTILGIDPGLTGALAVLHSDGSLTIHDMPTHQILVGKKNKRFVDNHGLRDILRSVSGDGVAVAYLEVATSMPQQGVTSVFNFGDVYGALKQVLADHEVRLETVLAKSWKKTLGLKKGKDASLRKASELFPQHASWWNLAKHHNRAEALLIAWYGMQQVGGAASKKRRRLSPKRSNVGDR